jgi:uncharacterized protein YbgA (DUF1722 family)
MYGYFKTYAVKEEKEAYFKWLQAYRNKQATFDDVLAFLNQLAIKYEETYLIRQVIFKPYPKIYLQQFEKLNDALLNR